MKKKEDVRIGGEFLGTPLPELPWLLFPLEMLPALLILKNDVVFAVLGCEDCDVTSVSARTIYNGRNSGLMRLL